MIRQAKRLTPNDPWITCRGSLQAPGRNWKCARSFSLYPRRPSGRPPAAHTAATLPGHHAVPSPSYQAYCVTRSAFAANRFTNNRAAPGTPFGSCRNNASVVYT